MAKPTKSGEALAKTFYNCLDPYYYLAISTIYPLSSFYSCMLSSVPSLASLSFEVKLDPLLTVLC